MLDMLKPSLATLILFLLYCNIAYGTGPIIAYGDSITAGWPYHDLDCYAKHDCGGYEPPLVDLLAARGDQHQVLNYGVPGEFSGEGEARLGSILSSTNPEYVLLNEGTNDLWYFSAEDATGNISEMADMVISTGATVIVGAITPDPRTNSSGGSKPIEYANALLRQNALAKSIPFADHYSALINNWDNLHSGDQLHPNTEGYRIMATTWYDVYSTLSYINIAHIILLLLEN